MQWTCFIVVSMCDTTACTALTLGRTAEMDDSDLLQHQQHGSGTTHRTTHHTEKRILLNDIEILKVICQLHVVCDLRAEEWRASPRGHSG